MQGSKMYQEVILDHYRNPRRWGHLSPVTFSHTGENTSCGDELTFDLRLAEELPGMTLSEVRDLDREDALDLLGIELTPMRVPCAVLAEKVVQDGVESHEND